MKKIFLLLLLAASICRAQNPNNNPAGANNTWVVVGNPAQQFSPTQKGTIQDAVNFAGPGGVVWIPPSYTGTESLLSIINPNNVLMVDMRGGTFQTYPPLPSGGGGSTTPPVASAVVSPVIGIDYGTVQHLQAGPSQIVTISSNGLLPLTVTGVAFTGPFSVLSNPCLNAQLIGGNQCSLLVFPTPVGTGAVESGSVTFTTTAPVDPQTPLTVPLKVRSTSLPSFLLTLTGFGPGSGTVSDGGLLNCHFINGVPDQTSTCQLNYPSGTVVHLTVTPDAGSTIGSLIGAGCSATPCDVTMSSAQTAAATFNVAPVPVQVSVTGIGAGAGRVVSDLLDVNTGLNIDCTFTAGVGVGRCSGLFNPGALVTLTESASGGSSFVAWTGALGCTTATTCPVTVNSTQTVTLNFTSTAVPIALVQSCNSVLTNQVTVVQHKAAQTTANQTTVAASTTSTGSGNLIVVATGNSGTRTVTSVTDNIGNTYTQAASAQATNGTTQTDIWYKLSATAGVTTVTVTYSGAAGTFNKEVWVWEVSGFGTAAFDVAGVVNAGAGVANVESGAAVTTTSATGFVAAVTVTSNTVDQNPLSGNEFTSGGDISATGDAAVSLISSTAGSHQAQWHLNNSVPNFASSTVAFKESASSSTLQCSWAQAQNAGDIIMCDAGWPDSTTTVSSIADSKSNTYTLGVGPQTTGGTPNLTDVLYYSKNIAAATAGANVTTMTINSRISGRGMVCEEYSGVTTGASPIDVSNIATANASQITANNALTTLAGDLVTGFSYAGSSISAASSGYTQQTTDGAGRDEEDKQGSGAGVAVATYNFQPSQSNTGKPWVTFNIGWKGQGAAGGTTNSLTVNCAGNGNGTVAMPGGATLTCTGGSPSGTPSVQVATGSTQNLLASALSGSVFSSWSGVTGCSTSANCSVPNITANTTLTATFTLAGQTNVYVATTGSDTSGTGTQANPWATVVKASTAAPLGPTGTIVNVAAGTYPGCITTARSGTVNQRFVYQGAANNASIIQATCTGTNNLVWWNKGDYSDVLGFALSGTQPGICIGLDNDGSFSTAQRNKIGPIPAISASCTNGGGGIVHTHRGSVAANGHDDTDDANLIDSVGLANGSCPNMHGIYGSISRLTLTNNIVSRACGWGVQFYHYTTQEVVANNVFIGNLRGCMVITASDGGVVNNNTSVFNNVCANNSGEGGIEERYGNGTGSSNTYRNNRFWGNTPTTGCSNQPTGFSLCEYNFLFGARTVSGPLTVGQNSQFVNYTGNSFTGDYHAASSTNLLIDTGTTGPCAPGGITPCVPPFAIDLTSRPQRTAFDQGAYELP